ncbi:EAL and HDOD domain-containing protein [Actinotalea fermentans]|uniref:EAL and HDOD domain-containing protein n=1 Tax=Actinotalea fermentans TaxID=43671 RepID=UPI000B2E4D98|nr:EAL domain-containing protein [Actinotalea fermentans]
MDQVHVDGGFVHPRAQAGSHVFVGRQGILDATGSVHGYEFLYRAGRQNSLRVDTWPAPAQDRATLRVLQALFTPTGVRSLAADAHVFVNFTRSFLVGDLPVPDEPERLVIEVVESVRTDAAVLAGVRRLRERGFRIAIDDFVGLTSQVALLPYADYVKVDCRDLFARGPALATLAASTGARLVAERIETAAELEACRALGFRLFQGFHLDTTLVLNRTPVPSLRTERPALRIVDAPRQRPGTAADTVRLAAL